MKKIIFYTTLYFFVAVSVAAAGGGDFSSISGTKTFSLNGLYFAGKSGLSSLQSNPAALVFLNQKALEISVRDNILQNEYESTSGFYKSYNNDNFTIGGGLNWNVNENLTFALGYYPLTDYLVDWPFVVLKETDSSSSVLAFSMLNRLEINSISPAVAFQLGNLSIGLSANIYQVIQQISFPITNDQWEEGVGLAGYQVSYNLDGWAYGGTLGLIYNFNDALSGGISVRSGFKAEIKGDAESNIFSELDSTSSLVNTSTELEIPWKFGAGLVYNFNENTAINIDFSYHLWGSIEKNLQYKFENSSWQNRTSVKDSFSGIRANSINLSLENSFETGIGLEHKSKSGLIYRAGYRFTKSPNTPSTYNLLFPGVDNNTITFGLGYKDKNLTIDAAIAYTFGFSEEISSSQNNLFHGKYDTDGYIPSLTIRYEF